MMYIKEVLLQWFINFYKKQKMVLLLEVKILNQQLAKELQKKKLLEILENFKGNTWGANIGDVRLLSKFNKGI